MMLLFMSLRTILGVWSFIVLWLCSALPFLIDEVQGPRLNLKQKLIHMPDLNIRNPKGDGHTQATPFIYLYNKC